MRVSESRTGESRKGAGFGERAGTDYVGESGCGGCVDGGGVWERAFVECRGDRTVTIDGGRKREMIKALRGA